jgi:hypothetical protein
MAWRCRSSASTSWLLIRGKRRWRRSLRTAFFTSTRLSYPAVVRWRSALKCMRSSFFALIITIVSAPLVAHVALAQKVRSPAAAGYEGTCGPYNGKMTYCAKGLQCTNTGWNRPFPKDKQGREQHYIYPWGICCRSGEEAYVAAYSFNPYRPIFKCRPKPCPPGQVRRGDRCDWPPVTPAACPPGTHRDPRTLLCVRDTPPPPPPPPLTCEQLGKVTGKRADSSSYCADPCQREGYSGFTCKSATVPTDPWCCRFDQVCHTEYTQNDSTFCTKP